MACVHGHLDLADDADGRLLARSPETIAGAPARLPAEAQEIAGNRVEEPGLPRTPSLRGKPRPTRALTRP